MIQRKQTLFLIIIIGLFISLLFVDIAGVNAGKGVSSFLSKVNVSNQLHTVTIMEYYPLEVLTYLISGISLLTIIMFKKPGFQVRMVSVLIVLIVGFMAMELYAAFGMFESKMGLRLMPKVPAFFPLVALIFAFAALRAIGKDIIRLKSYKRIR